MTQDALAVACRAVGLSWSRSAIAKLEAGHRASLTVEQLLLLAVALEVPAADLIPQGPEVRLSDTTTLPGARVVALLSAQPQEAHDAAEEAAAATTRAIREDHVTPERLMGPLGRARAHWPDLGGDDKPWLWFQAADASFREAETKAAERLGVEPVDVAAAALTRWGRSLTEHRDDRVQAVALDRGTVFDPQGETLRALRGHVTRDLLDELREELAEHGLIDNTEPTTETKDGQ